MARRNRHRGSHEEHMDESWLVPYADLLTLLFTLFLALFAISSVNKSKFDQLTNVMQSEFKSGTGILSYASITPELNPESSVKDSNKSVKENEEKYYEESEKYKQEMHRLEELKKQIDEFIVNRDLTGKFKTLLDDEGLMLIILDSALFASGSAEIVGEYRNIALGVSDLLVTDIPRKINISGHTDNRPINTREFESNWELSTARATNFLQVLVENNKLEQNLFTVSGNGEFKPIDSNETIEGRANNRRVEVLILPNFDQ